MADTLPTPRATPEVEPKVAALDELLKRYLLLLDQYTQARRQLSSDLSSGYISLAQANFSPSSRVRYGQDFYDERMQALRRVAIEETDLKLRRSISLLGPRKEPTTDEEEKEKPASSKDKSREGPNKVSTDAISASVAELSLDHDVKDESKPQSGKEVSKPQSSSVDGDGDKKKGIDKAQENEICKKPRADDPIRWFGILVPPALRTAQGGFIRAAEGPVPKLVDLAAEMKELEIEIGRARKAIRKSAS